MKDSIRDMHKMFVVTVPAAEYLRLAYGESRLVTLPAPLGSAARVGETVTVRCDERRFCAEITDFVCAQDQGALCVIGRRWSHPEPTPTAELLAELERACSSARTMQITGAPQQLSVALAAVARVAAQFVEHHGAVTERMQLAKAANSLSGIGSGITVSATSSAVELLRWLRHVAPTHPRTGDLIFADFKDHETLGQAWAAVRAVLADRRNGQW